MLEEALEHLVKGIVEHPDDVSVASHGLRRGRVLEVRVHPDDLALLREHAVAEEHWQLLPDPALARGDCLLESERSRLDARVDTRLAAVVDAVLGMDEDDGDEEITA